MEIVKRGVRGTALVAMALVVAVAASAQPPGGAAKVPTLQARLAHSTKQKEELIGKFLEALGPAMREQRLGKSVALPGVGIFNVVRVAEHRNLVEGRVVVVPAANYIEFVPAGVMVNTANTPGAVPVRTVPGFEYNPNPRMEPGIRTEGIKVGRTRSR